MHAALTTPALVLRRADYSDNDRMVTLFSPTMGRVEAIARGCRRPRSPLMNAAECFTSGEYQLFQNRDRYAVEQCSITESFMELRGDYDRLRYGVYYLKLLEQAVMPDTPAPELFMMSLQALTYLNYGDQPPELVTLAFEMHYVMLMGIAPRMDSCTVCGKSTDGDAQFDIRRGGVVCPKCRSYAPFISNGARRILMKLPRTRFERFTLLSERSEWPEAARFSRAWMKEHVPVDVLLPEL